VQLWVPGNPVPPEWIEAARNPEWIAVAHNDQFETLIERHIMGPRYGWPLIPIERHRCTMTMALAAGLPAKLERVADYLELSNRKDAAGERLMHQMSKPRKPRKGEDPNAGPY
jgi:DNA polymerase bacteriophage-type